MAPANPLPVAVRAVELHVLNMRTRMPFRYGIASMTALPHLFVRAQVEAGGRQQVGIASEGLPPKWFTKDPRTTFRQDLDDMLRVIRHAATQAVSLGETASVFDFWRALHQEQERWARVAGYPPLLSGLGTSLIERAVIDACCRATGTTLAAAVRRNAFGLRLGDLHPELAGTEPASLLPPQPLRSVIARHTVGLGDPLADDEIAPHERLDDGLPQSLEACIRAYGLTHFKIKLYGDVARDLDRLERIARLLAPLGSYAFTLDGNEQFEDASAFVAFWQALIQERSLAGLLRHLLFVEQPLHRDAALSPAAAATFRSWEERPPMIIDESDGTPDAPARALDAGYAGTSHKNCKGVLRGIASACLIAHRTAASGRRLILSGEDLANVGPVALLQDLAVMATLGVEHVERNGHHYFAGLSMLPEDVQAAVLAHHGDLYRRHPRGFPTLDVRGGRIAIGSVVDAPFGTGFLLDPTRFTSLDEWRYESLGVDEPTGSLPAAAGAKPAATGRLR